ncbi:cutinase transcription factor 1 beta [Fusarium albosuccineum]|uniref:Cutinase transcription factor 1 beta n=1 Tax=Fusarium albosuccineum TaxID=1237068 RepID=A0A8H4LG73_9HYPO|nr:cutinase transcription factor 1 beta [Fusarium albosuccineum]
MLPQPSDSTQRLSSGADKPTAQRPRAAKACSSCHMRKVRCDVARVGLPCTKCKDSSLDCAIRARKKRRSNIDSGRIMGGSGSTPMRPNTLPEHVIRHQIPHYNFLQNFAPTANNHSRPEGLDSGKILMLDPQDQSTTLDGSSLRMSTEEMNFLEQTGALDLPPKAILDECVSKYFQVFHPFFPVIGRPSFLANYWKCDEDALRGGQGPSLLLLQAVVFTASAYIPMHHVQGMGFSNRQEARKCFYKRTRQLYQFNHELDDIVTIPALLLISHYYPSMAEQRHTWFWVHQAISLAQGAGLHRDSGYDPRRKLWARTWWACLARDRLTALGTGRPMHINSLDCNVPLLTAEDVEEEGDTEDDRAIKAIYIDFIKLCNYMEGVLSLQFVTSNPTGNEVRVCESTLQNWASNLSSASKRAEEETSSLSSGTIPLLYQTLLHLIYNGAQYKDRPEKLPSAEMVSIAADSANLLADLMKLDLIEYLPTTR